MQRSKHTQLPVDDHLIWWFTGCLGKVAQYMNHLVYLHRFEAYHAQIGRGADRRFCLQLDQKFEAPAGPPPVDFKTAIESEDSAGTRLIGQVDEASVREIHRYVTILTQ